MPQAVTSARTGRLMLAKTNDRRFRMEQVCDAPAGNALAAGRHHITNFDADSARDAAPCGSIAGVE